MEKEIKHRRLQEMDRSDFGVVKGEPDIRGWDVRNSSGRKIGEVEELVVDAQQKKVRYMVVDLKSNELDLRNHKVLIPIGLAELDKDEDDVILPSITLEHLRHLPTYDLRTLDDTTERMICVALGREQDWEKTEKKDNLDKQKEVAQRDYHPVDDDEFYRHSYYNDDNLYRHRLHEAQPAKSERRDDNRRGLHLFDWRNEKDQREDERYRGVDRERELDEEKRMEMIRNRRRLYEDRRSHRSDRTDYNDDDYDRRRNDPI